MVRKSILHFIIGMIVTCAGFLACQTARPPESAERLYSQMTQQNVIEFQEFPQALESIKGRHNGTILANEKDTLQLICSYPNIADEKNRYPMYFICDNHGNSWNLVQEEQGKYKLYRHQKEDIITLHDYIKHFCGGGVYLVAVLLPLLILGIISTADPKEKQLTVKEVIGLALLVFFFGGCIGLALM